MITIYSDNKLREENREGFAANVQSNTNHESIALYFKNTEREIIKRINEDFQCLQAIKW